MASPSINHHNRMHQGAPPATIRAGRAGTPPYSSASAVIPSQFGGAPRQTGGFKNLPLAMAHPGPNTLRCM